MEKTFSQNQVDIQNYAIETFKPEDEILKNIVNETRSNDLPLIQLGPMDGLHLEVLTRMVQAEKAVEIGTLAGYSGVCIARGLSESGKLYTFDVSEKNANLAKQAFKKAGLQNKVEVLVGPALENLPKIEIHGPFDLVFIDADKENYSNYFDWAEKNLIFGGIIVADNTFAFGHIADQNLKEEDKPSVFALRKYNQKVAEHPKFRSTILPTGEGLTVSIKISD